MTFTPADINKLSEFYRHNELVLHKPGKRIQNWFEQNFDIQQLKNSIKMDGKTKREAREQLKSDLGFDVLEGLPGNLDRLAMSEIAKDEKLASVAPNEHFVLVNSPNCRIPLMGMELSISKGCSLRVPVEQIELERINNVVVVENLDVFDELPTYSAALPLIEDGTVFVYRGHEKSIAKGVKSVLEKAPAETSIYWFGDLDPKGLELAFSSKHVNFIISADISNETQLLQKISSMEKWLEQKNAIAWCEKQPQRSYPLIAGLLDNKLAVMQQHLLSRKLPLVSYLNPNVNP